LAHNVFYLCTDSTICEFGRNGPSPHCLKRGKSMGSALLTAPPAAPFIRPRFETTPDAATGTLSSGQSLALGGIAHDARNLVTALKLCAELIAEPGVLAPPHLHFLGEIRSIGEAADHLVRRLSAIARTSMMAREIGPREAPIENLADAIHELSGLLTAIAGPAIGMQIACLPCAGRLRLSEENLTRILLNLVRNAADAMPTGGRIRITAQRGGGESFLWTLPAGADDSSAEVWDDESTHNPSSTVVMAVEDDGPGIEPELLERIFEPGFSTRRDGRAWPEAEHHGLGLSIVRQLVEQAGGTLRVVTLPRRGARFEMELPLTNVTPSLLSEPAISGGSDGR
jgi:signal transduction histidine kinase